VAALGRLLTVGLSRAPQILWAPANGQLRTPDACWGVAAARPLADM
jgi:hypothetical protein